jgi:hypothetical protein
LKSVNQAERHSKEAELQRLLNPTEQDVEAIELWRHRSPAEHAAASIRLSNRAAQLAAETGFQEAPGNVLPGFLLPRK